MFHSNSSESSVLICTPDYPPRLGGLSTFTLNIEKVLKQLNIKFDLLVWSGSSEIRDFPKKEGHQYDYMIHIHGLSYQVLSQTKKYSNKAVLHINFFHGSEVLFKGRNFLFTLLKKLMKPMALNQFEKSYANISISEFTLNKMQALGYKVSYDRDIIIHNGIDINAKAQFIPKSYDDDVLSFICMARDVPHKNAAGVKSLMEACSRSTYKKIRLYSGFNLESNSFFEHENISGIDNEKLQFLYGRCHFNLLLSLDHSSKGYYEGFGLTVLEAGQYGTPSIVSSFGGLPEACHNRITGWVLELNDLDMRQFFRKLTNKEYKDISQKAYLHTKKSHSLDIYSKVLSHLISDKFIPGERSE